MLQLPSQLHSPHYGTALYQEVSETFLDQSKKTFCRPWGREFSLPDFLVYKLCRVPSFCPGQPQWGLSSLFQNGWRGCKPGTPWLPTAICRCFSRRRSQVWSLPAGAGGKCRQAERVQWTNHSSAQNEGRTWLQPLLVVLEAACVQNWGDPVLHASVSLQQCCNALPISVLQDSTSLLKSSKNAAVC